MRIRIHSKRYPIPTYILWVYGAAPWIQIRIRIAKKKSITMDFWTVFCTIYILWMYLGELLVLHGLQRFSLRPLNIVQIILMVLRTGDHGLEESGSRNVRVVFCENS